MPRHTSKDAPKHRLREAREACHWSQRDVADRLGTTGNTVSRWELGQTVPSPYFRAKLCTLFGTSAQELGLLPDAKDQPQAIAAESKVNVFVEAASASLLPDAPNIWGIPYARNLFFTGREELLHSLYKRLHQENALALTQSWAISGLGGIGKTQMALEYAYRYRHTYTAILWTSAATREALFSGFVTIAGILQLPERNEQDQKRVIEAVKKWFASHQQWLLILDNADDIAIVPGFLPMKQAGHLLITTRAQALGALAQQIEVETMGVAEATQFLLRRTKRLAPDAPLDQASENDLAGAEAIAIAMDFLPLALDQAGAYIEEVGCSLSTYLELYQTYRKELLLRRGHVPTDHPEPVATTWSLNFQQVEQNCPAAAHLLRLCAFLEPDAIPEELISEGGAFLGPVLQHTVTDPLLLNEAIEELRKFSLIQRDPESKLLRVHRLVQAVLRESMGREEQRCWAERAVRVTSTAFPGKVEAVTWAQCQRYLPQAQVCCTLIQDYALTFEEAASLLFRTACYLQDYALYEQAEPLYQQSLHIREQGLGPKHPEVATSLYGLAILYRRQGKYKESEPLLQQALHIREQELGPKHPEVATSLHGLAEHYFQQGKYEKAEPLYQRALHIREQVLGQEHPEVAYSLHGLADLYFQQGKYEKAEPLYQQAICIREQVLGLEHPEVAKPLNNLGILYKVQGKFQQAEPLFQRALSILERALGLEHAYVAYPLDNLALIYFQQGKYKEAEPLYKRALHIREQALGPDHPDVAHPLSNLAELYKSQGKFEEAEKLYQRALYIRKQALGVTHLHVAIPLQGLADLYKSQGKYKQAKSLYQQALHIRKQALGPEHAYVASPLQGLADLCCQQGKEQEAERLYLQVLRIREQALGPNHPEVAFPLIGLAELALRQGKGQEAMPLYQRAFAIREQSLGAHHPQTIETRICLYTVLLAMSKTEEAARLHAAQPEEGKLEQGQ